MYTTNLYLELLLQNFSAVCVRRNSEGAFDNTSFHAIITAARERGLEKTCCRWVRSMVKSRLVLTSLMGSSMTAKVMGCPQGRVLSPLLWNLVVDRLLTYK
jgi:hypothetical protein